MGTKPPILRNDAEETEDRDDASAGTQLKKFIADASMAMDSIAKRMDAMEERFAKKDEKEEEEKKDEARDMPRETSASKDSKKDESEEEEEKKDSTVIYRGNKAPSPNRKDEKEEDRKDAEEKERMDAKKDAEEKESREDAARKDSASDERLKRLEATLGDVVAVLPKKRSDDEYHDMCDIQARADEVYSAFGQRSAPRFMDGEDSLGYRRRLVRDLKKHSPDWKDVEIHKIADEGAFSVMERRVYADAMNVARSPVTAEAGTLRAVHKTGPGGHQITEYVGETSAWFEAFSGPVRQYVTSISNGSQR